MTGYPKAIRIIERPEKDCRYAVEFSDFYFETWYALYCFVRDNCQEFANIIQRTNGSATVEFWSERDALMVYMRFS